jgi:hypothetical protein
MEKIVPAISSGTAGPLGAIHLPRLWLKLLLASEGRLPEGYDECGPGFDQMTLNNLGLDREATIAYVRSAKPTYVQFEAWVRQNGKHVDPESIEKHNQAVRAYQHKDETVAKMQAALGLSAPEIRDAVTLNALDDWMEIHAQVVGGR